MERAKGLDGNNFVTVVMRQKGLGLQEAADFVACQFKERLAQFIEDRKNLRSFGKDVDADVEKYVFSISQWCIGSIIWSFKTPRYFGADYEEVKRTLVVKLNDFEEDSTSDSDSESGDLKHHGSDPRTCISLIQFRCLLISFVPGSASESWVVKMLYWCMSLLK